MGEWIGEKSIEKIKNEEFGKERMGVREGWIGKKLNGWIKVGKRRSKQGR